MNSSIIYQYIRLQSLHDSEKITAINKLHFELISRMLNFDIIIMIYVFSLCLL